MRKLKQTARENKQKKGLETFSYFYDADWENEEKKGSQERENENFHFFC